MNVIWEVISVKISSVVTFHQQYSRMVSSSVT